MTPFISRRTLGFALGGILAVMAGACSDVPSAPVKQFPLPQFPNPLAPRAADIPIIDAGLPTLLPGEKVRRRLLRTVDGAMMQEESVVGANGLPRVTVLRQGAASIRIETSWAGAGSWDAVQQQVTVRAANGHVSSFDARALAPGELETARASLRADALRLAAVSLSSRIRSLEEDPAACEAEVKAANIATWQYTAAAGAVLVGAITGNVTVTSTLYTAYLAAYANYEAKQVDLDKCIAAIGKTPEVDEY